MSQPHHHHHHLPFTL
jgi:hypothetical protein